jgi:hypothetical protein
MLDHIRQQSDCWQIGLNMFFQSVNIVVQFYGLSIVREYLAYHAVSLPSSFDIKSNCQHIRDGIMNYITGITEQNISINPSLLNNLVSVVTLLIKIDYPEIWSTAFDDLLALGMKNIVGK